MTFQEIVDRAVTQAKLTSPLSGGVLEVAANSLLPQVFIDAAKRVGSSALPKLTKTLTFTDGVAALPSDVLSGFLTDSVLYDAADPTKEYSYVEQWGDFVRVYDTRIGYYTAPDDVRAIEPGSRYAEATGITGDRTLVVAGVPAVPASASSTIDASAEFTLVALDLLVERLKGATP